ncbi:MAG: endonuclease domain-containing protein [Mycobacterium sp.]
MSGPFIGSEALARGMTWGALQRGHTRVFRNVYVPVGTELSAEIYAESAWLWSGRRGVVGGFGAAALLGSKWIDRRPTIDLYHQNRHRLAGLCPRAERLEDADICVVRGVPVTTPERTALDLACWYPLMKAVAAIDALARATDLTLADVAVMADRAYGRRGIERARRAIGLADSGAQSPKESWLRTLLIEAGLPRPQTQIPVHDEWGKAIAYLDLGWKELRVAAEYDGDHHRTNRSQYSYDVRRSEMLARRGWIVIRVTADDAPEGIVRRVRDALARRV